MYSKTSFKKSNLVMRYLGVLDNDCLIMQGLQECCRDTVANQGVKRILNGRDCD